MPIQKITADSPEARSANIVHENLEHLRELFPEAFKEGGIDFDVLRQLLGDEVDDGEEKFGLNWHGKKRARKLALTPSTGTLRPVPEDSVDWDTTQNLLIEGDNLEVLKLLQKSYAGKVKLIYIDPPYNTGKDFVYPDNFHDNIQNYLELTGQVEDGRKVSSNTESSGRFHTDWLNMMYPRLRLARNLLREDGLLVISSDETEADNIRLVCDEIFGDDNFVERVVWKNKYGSGALTRGFANVHEYITIYSRNPISNIQAPLSDEQRESYRGRDENYDVRGGYVTQPLATRSKDPRPNLVYPIQHEGAEIWPDKQWIWSQDRMLEAYANGEVVISESDGKYSVRMKQYLRDAEGVERLGKPVSIMTGPFNQEGTREIEDLFGERVFPFPKPLALIKYFARLVQDDKPDTDGVYLDFFAGSGTTGQAIMEQNAEDQGTRRFVLVQLPEPLDPASKADAVTVKFLKNRDLPLNIAELTKERLRVAGARLKESASGAKPDYGFRVFRLDSSNIRPWDSASENLEQTLLDHEEHIRPDRSEADVLYEVLLKLGLDLCVPMEISEVSGLKVFSIGGGVLFACLSPRMTAEAAEAVATKIGAWRRELAPAGDSTAVFRDSAFESDVAKANLVAILEQAGIAKVRSL